MADYSSSSSSSSYLVHNMQESKKVSGKQTHGHYASLHSVRRAPAKPWKKPVAPLPPTPPRVYKVDPMNFRDLVQKLTAAPQFSSSAAQSRLHTVAPPPLHVEAAPQLLRPLPEKPSLSAMYKEFSDTLDVKSNPKASDGFLGLNLSPSSYGWCSIPLLSPGTLSSLEHTTVL